MLIACVAALGMRTTGTVLRSADSVRRSKRRTAYYATEIDKYAIQTTQHNFPDTVQLGDAFQVRNDDWRVKE